VRSRRFNKRVEIWQVAALVDGYGGNTTSEETLLTATWADIKTLGVTSRFSNGQSSPGVNEPNAGVVFFLRKRKDLSYNSLNQFIKYNGVKYIISNRPTNINFDNSIIEIIGVAETIRETTEVPPVGGTVYPYTYDYLLS
jgi:hypothetical protein